MHMYLYEKYVHQKIVEINIYIELSHIYPKLFEPIHGRSITSNDLPELSSAIMTQHMKWKNGEKSSSWIEL